MTNETAHAFMEDLQRIFTQYRFLFSDKLAEATGMAILALEKQPEQKNGKKFIKIVTSYSMICPYPEYKRKPYFSIQYEENGEKFESFGTYNPEVLSKYIREYFMGAEKGKWVRDEFGSKCSCCGLYAYRDEWGDPWESNFCPNCGAELEVPEDV